MNENNVSSNSVYRLRKSDTSEIQSQLSHLPAADQVTYSLSLSLFISKMGIVTQAFSSFVRNDEIVNASTYQSAL